jgi:glycosyltransferase involved in cell wall biosynthesis
VSRISIVLPIHNAERYLDRALANLLACVPSDSEVIVVDDHSDDDSLRVVRTWQSQGLQNVVILENPGRGVAAARNLAVEAATGDYLWFTDCDDDWSPAIVERLAEVAHEVDADIVVCNATKVAQPSGLESLIEDAPRDETISGSEAYDRLLSGALQGHLWNKLFKTALFSAETFPPTRAHSDLGGMFSVIASARRVAMVPEALYTYYVHDGSVLNSRQYRWDDLWDCLDLATKQLAPEERSQRNLITFKYRNVIVPVVNESIRREDVSDPLEIAGARKRARHAASLTEAVRLVRWGQRDAAVRAGLIKLAFPLYRAMYKRHRAKKWAELDSFATPAA